MNAGDSLDVSLQMTWDVADLQPADYSFVVWADEDPVNIEVTRHIEVTSHGGASESFPTFRMSDSVNVYDL